VGDKYENRIMLPLSLSYDHRVIDGAEGARFCVHLKESLGKDFAYKLAV
jgi:pyruvate dehydrogenase E2 component (dihydrolipoamide acetyltransferase)